MSGPEPAALAIAPGSGFRPRGLSFSLANLAQAAIALLAVLGIVMYLLRLGEWGDRPEWAYPTATMMWMLATVSTAPLLAYATRMTRGYWSYPVRRIATLFAIPATLGYALLIPVLASLPSLDGRASLWFEFRFGAPVVTDAVAVATMALAGLGLLWVTSIPDLAANGSCRFLTLGWRGNPRQWRALKMYAKLLGAFYLMTLVFTTMLLTTDLGQSLIPGWRSGIFPAYHVVTGFQTATALVVLTAYLVQRFCPQARPFIGREQAINLGRIFLAFTLLVFYFFWADFVLVWYARLPGEIAAMQVNIAEVYGIAFAIAGLCHFGIPFVCLIFNPLRRRFHLLALVAVVALFGSLADRIRLFVPAISNTEVTGHGPLDPLPAAVWPALDDVLFMVGWIGLLAFAYIFTARWIPLLSGWEMREGALYRDEVDYGRAKYLLLAKPD